MSKNKHDFRGAGLLTKCKKCGEFLLDLGIPQKPCKPNKNKKRKKNSN